MSTRPQYPAGSDPVPFSFDRLCGNPDSNGYDNPYAYSDPYEDSLVQPEDDNWYEELADASGLDTSPVTGHVSPTVVMEEGASFAKVLRNSG